VQTFCEKFALICPTTVDANFGSALRTYLVEQSHGVLDLLVWIAGGVRWNVKGHANVPLRYKTADGYLLGRWVVTNEEQKTICHRSGNHD